MLEIKNWKNQRPFFKNIKEPFFLAGVPNKYGVKTINEAFKGAIDCIVNKNFPSIIIGLNVRTGPYLFEFTTPTRLPTCSGFKKISTHPKYNIYMRLEMELSGATVEEKQNLKKQQNYISLAIDRQIKLNRQKLLDRRLNIDSSVPFWKEDTDDI